MTTGPSPEYVNRQLQLADEALSDSHYLLQDARLKAAINRAYYAMFYAAQAALSSGQVRMPKTHRGVLTLFNSHYVRTGKVNAQFARDFRTAFNLRQQSDYEAYTNVEETQVQDMVQKAEAFVTEVRKLLG